MIPKILFQTSANKLDDDYMSAVKAKLGSEWTYYHFTDNQILGFFKRHPLAEFPNVAECFNKLQGAHRADIFRLYFLVVHGGVYMESDAMLVGNSLDNLLANKELVTIRGVDRKNVFPGILAATKNHPAIVDALRMAYVADLKEWEDDYFLSCRHLANVIDNSWINKDSVELHTERGTSNPTEFASYDNHGNIFLMHFPYTKKVPNKFLHT